MKSLNEFILEAEQISADTIAAAAVKSVAAVRSLLTKNGFECDKIDKYSDVPSYEVRGCKVASAAYEEFKIYKDDIELGRIYYKKYNLTHFITRNKDVLYSMRFVPNYNVKLENGYTFYEIMSDLSKKKWADESACKLFADLLLKYM